MPKIGSQHIFLQQRDVELLDRISGRGEARAEIERVPLPAKIETELVFARRLGGSRRFDDEHAVELFQQLLG